MDLWKSFWKEVLQACDELCGKTKGGEIAETHDGGTSS